MKHENPDTPAELFLEWLRPIRRDLEVYCRRLMWDPQEVPDAIHNAMLRAVAAFDRCWDAQRFRAWMFKILTHEALALNRKHARIARFEFQVEPDEMEELAAPGPGLPWGPPPAMRDWRENLDDELNAALKTLTEPERAVLLLRAMGGFQYQEIAGELSLPVGSVMGYLARARKKMQAALGRKNLQTPEPL
jgi:RNA polymerase sigma-70 factor (ECF subfamily)